MDNNALGGQLQGIEGFNLANKTVLEDLTKALTAGSGTDSATFTGGRALIPESLDKTLVNVLWSQDEARLFQKLKKQSVSSVVNEWNKRDDVGNSDGAWVAEGGNSFEKDQNIERITLQMKYLQTKRSTTIQANVAKTTEGAEAIEVNAGTLWLVREVEKVLFGGRAAIISEQPDGLDVSIPGSNIIDMKGLSASSLEFEKAMTRGGRIIRDNYGKPTDLFCSTTVMEDVQDRLRDRFRFNDNSNGDGISVFERYPTPSGKIELIDDVFIQAGLVPSAGSSLTAERPQTVPTFTVAKANSSSSFEAGDAGDYDYQLVAVNKFGDGVASAVVTMAAVVANDIVTLTVTNAAAVLTGNATGLKVFRTKPDGTELREMKGLIQVGAPATIDDLNEERPGTSSAYILNIAPNYNAIEWNQFLPMMKFPLYPTDAAIYPFLMLLFGALAVKKQEQHVRIKNILSVADDEVWV